jgi:hypothetical protein
MAIMFFPGPEAMGAAGRRITCPTLFLRSLGAPRPLADAIGAFLA